MKTGLIAEFRSPAALAAALRRLRELGYQRIDGFSPYPLEELEGALGLRRSRISWAVLIAAICGGGLAYFIQYWTNAVSYPLNVASFPAHSAPSFIPITFETTVLFGAFAAFIGFFVAAKLPRLWDPVFEVEGFERASIDRFFAAIDAEDSRFDFTRTLEELRALQPLSVRRLGGGP